MINIFFCSGKVADIYGLMDQGSISATKAPEIVGMFVATERTEFVNTALMNGEPLSAEYQVYNW